MKTILTALALSLAAGPALAPAANAQDAPAELGMGVFTFTSGPAAAYGMPGRNAAELIIDQINADGGIGGAKIVPTYVDEGQGGESVVSEFRRLAGDGSVDIMVAALSSGNCMALAPIADQLEMPMVTWNCDTHQLFLGAEHPYVFRPNSSTVPEFVAYAAYVAQKVPDAKRIAIINPDYAFGHDAAAIFTAAMKAFNPDVEVVAELFPKLGTPTFNTEISRIAAARPDIIFSNLWGGDLENFVRQASARGLFRSSQVVLALGESVLQRVDLPEGVIVGVLGDGFWNSPDAKGNEAAQGFAEAYHEKFGEWPVFPGMKMANTILVVKQAYEEAMEAAGGWPTKAQVLEALSDIEAETLTGTVTVREDHDGLVDQIVGVSTGSDTPELADMARYSGEAITPPVGVDPIEWVSTLTPEFAAELPAPGSYQ
ncbi:ABC transporter substrate-binding protein [Acuticoccus sp. I52.16.1]|uniref:ABC transporter substrate-binding protein n=1 Tax=Acuticoccus sp. I52.16.1 TaxID=2928472 RepID=UPI001FD149AF|nr:ABC transporter substrate-binding protein [Acuticoccus sp. I52.16.1]UOM33905.1 ABC transporter substrate-binding protein [Acuticoccus sp. I52.16.1]